ncbi:hypothetical protein NKG94_22840 [Micromonospora sp. M12]
MVWTAYLVLAKHGDDSDVPALLAGWDWLDRRTDDRCGYDDLAVGIARIGGRAARAVVPGSASSGSRRTPSSGQLTYAPL